MTNYLVNESDGSIDFDYAYLLTLKGRVTTDTKPCTVLGHKFANLREAKEDSKEEKKIRTELSKNKKKQI